MTTNGIRDKVNNGWGKVIITITLSILIPVVLGCVGYGVLKGEVFHNSVLAASNNVRINTNAVALATYKEKVLRTEKNQDTYTEEIKSISSSQAVQAEQIKNINKNLEEVKRLIEKIAR